MTDATCLAYVWWRLDPAARELRAALLEARKVEGGDQLVDDLGRALAAVGDATETCRRLRNGVNGEARLD